MALFLLSYCGILPVGVHAGSGGPFAANAVAQEPTGPVGVKVPFDSIVVAIDLSASARRFSDRLAAISEADALLEKAIEKKLQLDLPAGLTFSVSNQGAPSSSQRERTIVIPITKTSDVPGIMATLSKLADDLPWPRDIDVRVSEPELTISDPEHLRPEILKALRTYLDKIRESIGGDVQFEITGLTEPVEVEPLSDREAFVSIPAQITIRTK